MPANFAMPVAVPSISGDDAGTPEAGLAAGVAAGPGLQYDGGWLADLRRESLLESLLAGGAIAAAAGAEHGHKLERALSAGSRPCAWSLGRCSRYSDTTRSS